LQWCRQCLTDRSGLRIAAVGRSLGNDGGGRWGAGSSISAPTTGAEKNSEENRTWVQPIGAKSEHTPADA
jgi:hypothetical protein